MLIAFLIVPLSISYLGNQKYGLWLTVYSFIGWFNFFDFGIGHGLRNKLTEAWAHKNAIEAKKHVSTAYFSLLFIICGAIFIFLLIFPLIPWESIFKVDDFDIRRIIFLIYIIFISNLLLSQISVVFLADQKSSVPGLIQLIGQLITLLSIYFVLSSNANSLLLYAGIIMGSQSIVFLIATVIAFAGKYRNVTPNIKYFDKNNFKELFQISGNFLIIQVAGTFLFTTDNFIINYYFGAEEVTIFNVAYKYFMVPIVVIYIISTPYWSGFTDAFYRKKFDWIKKSLSNLLKISLAAVFFTIVMIIFADQFYAIWVGELLVIPFLLTLLIGINTIFRVMLEPLIMLINGVGKLKIQMYTALFSSLMNIPLSIFLSVYLELGIPGVVLASLISTLIGIIIYPIQAIKILNNTANGFWNE